MEIIMPPNNDFHGTPIRILENQFVRLEYLQSAPRIVRLNLAGGSNLFADLGNELITTSFGDFYFRGGHRLWHSPEAMPRSYLPDVPGVKITDIPGGVRIDQPEEPWTHISKSIEIRLNEARPQVIVQHELRNEGAWAVELSPWALTMLRLGGVGIFPQPVGNSDPAGLLANRQISIWPYTMVDDSRLIFRNDCILIKAMPIQAPSPEFPPVKIGYFNPHGWMAYWIDGVLFVKRFDPIAGVNHPDGGCNTESYCNHKFIELETLGPLVTLAPETTVIHTETWELYTSLDQPFIPDEIRKLLSKSE
jgi:hypothetical protein